MPQAPPTFGPGILRLNGNVITNNARVAETNQGLAGRRGQVRPVRWSDPSIFWSTT